MANTLIVDGSAHELQVDGSNLLLVDSSLQPSYALGVTMTVAVERGLAASMALGYSMASTLTRERDEAATEGLGFVMSAALTHTPSRRQPQICVVT